MNPSTFSELDFPEQIRADEILKTVDSPFQRDITELVSYILQPTGRIPPNIHVNNIGPIVVTNINEVGASISDGVVKLDKIKNFNDFMQMIDLYAEAMGGNICHYPALEEPSNSSKFIHGLNINELNRKWDGKEFNHDEQLLLNYIREFSKKYLHIDDDIIIESAKIVNCELFLRIRNSEFDVTIPMGYNTKRELYTLKNGDSCVLLDCNGNPFSSKGFHDIERSLSKENIIKIIDHIHETGGTIMMNFYCWRAPEYVTKENYKHYYHTVVLDNISDEEAAKRYDGVVHHFGDNLRVVIKRVHGRDGNSLNATHDQLLPDFGRKNGTKSEQENYKYWEKTFENNLFDLIDLGVDSFRIDLAHGFRRDGDCRILEELVEKAELYAYNKYGKDIKFLFETYNLGMYGGTNIDDFTYWNEKYQKHHIIAYNTDLEKNLQDIKRFGGRETLLHNLKSFFTNLDYAYNRMIAISTFDDYSLVETGIKAGIDSKYILEIIFLLGKAGYNTLYIDRDIQLEYGEVVPLAPGGECKNTGSESHYITHCLPTQDELDKHLNITYLDNLKDSYGLKLLKEITNLPEIIGINVEGDNLIFTFSNNDKRIFDFRSLMNSGHPFTVEAEKGPEMLSDGYLAEVEKIKKLEFDIGKKLGHNKLSQQQLSLLNNHDFWYDFSEDIKKCAFMDEGILRWDNNRQRDYFLLNRKKLITNYLLYRGIDFSIQDEFNYGYWLEFSNFIKTNAWENEGIHDHEKNKQKDYFKNNKDILINEFLLSKNIKGSKDDVYNFDFWLEFINYVKTYVLENSEIAYWNTYEQGIYFNKNRDEIIQSFLNSVDLDFIDLDNKDLLLLSKEVFNLRRTFRTKAEKILLKNIKQNSIKGTWDHYDNK